MSIGEVVKKILRRTKMKANKLKKLKKLRKFLAECK